MIINTDDWMTLAEAARELGVTGQRVFTMAHEDGSLDLERPWARVALVSRSSVAARQRGETLMRIQPQFVRRYVEKHGGVADIHRLDPPVIQHRCREFIEGARPRWADARKDQWAQDMALKLYTTGGAK